MLAMKLPTRRPNDYFFEKTESNFFRLANPTRPGCVKLPHIAQLNCGSGARVALLPSDGIKASVVDGNTC